jgi:aldose 1-epimerase
MDITKDFFGTTPDGQDVHVYTLTNKNGMKARVLDYGGMITQLWAPDRKGKFQDIILGYDNMAGVLTDKYYFGVVVGRYANRIAGGVFSLDTKQYKLARNDGNNHLHGGIKGFDKVVYQAETIARETVPSLKLTYLSKDGEEGYPGNLDVSVYYTLVETNELSIEYTANTDRRTVVNLTNHMYFNLTADFETDILQHELQINADRFTPVDATLIPTGQLLPVEGTPLDFIKLTPIGARINQGYEQLQFSRGYDHNFVLNKKPATLSLAAKVYEPASGRILEVMTTEPGIQFYSGNFLDGARAGKGGKIAKYRSGLCLEPQHFPDSPNKPDFPSTVLDPGNIYNYKTVYKFSARK